MNQHIPSPRLTGRAGFSMIELLTALVIVSVVMALAVPAMSRGLSSYRTEAAVEQVRNDLMLARMTAIRSGRSASLRISGSSYTVTVDTGTTPGVIRRVDLAGKDLMVTVTAASPTITFDSRGMVRAGSGTVKIARQGKTDSLTISPVGRIYRVHY